MIALYLSLTGILCAVSAARYESSFIFYHGSTSDSFPLIEGDRVLSHPKFKKCRSTVVYIHGYTQNPDKDDVKAIINAYIKNDSYNILVLDWRELAAAFYLIPVYGIDELGLEVAKIIQNITQQGYPIKKFHLVGHSLGAHLCGCVGRSIKKLSNDSLVIPRISGLDPAFPGFYILTIGPTAISTNDAAFVDIIHTNVGKLGAPVNTGTVDFYPNGRNSKQPGCTTDVYSHQRSVYLFAESVLNIDKVPFMSRHESSDKIKIQMGINCPVNATPGTYLLETNAQSPFSRS